MARENMFKMTSEIRYVTTGPNKTRWTLFHIHIHEHSKHFLIQVRCEVYISVHGTCERDRVLSVWSFNTPWSPPNLFIPAQILTHMGHILCYIIFILYQYIADLWITKQEEYSCLNVYSLLVSLTSYDTVLKQLQQLYLLLSIMLMHYADC